jgi:hypothetical protein
MVLVAGATPVAVPPTLPLPADAPTRDGGLLVSLNVREAPTTSAALLGKLSNATAVTLLGRNAAGDWWLVCCTPGGAENGWVSAQFITYGRRRSDAGGAAGDHRARDARCHPGTPATPISRIAAMSPTLLTLATLRCANLSCAGRPSRILAFTLTNTGDAAAVDAELSFEAPVGVELCRRVGG